VFELFIPTSQTFQDPRSYIPLQTVTYNSGAKVTNSRFRFNQTIRPRVLVNDSRSSNVGIKSTVLMTSQKHKPRRHSNL